VEKLKWLVEFYPGHIEKEEKVFLPASRAYFTYEEDQVMLGEFWAFDRKMIHEKYAAVVESLGGLGRQNNVSVMVAIGVAALFAGCNFALL
jgi:hemerythrin-like domain-containing protein